MYMNKIIYIIYYKKLMYKIENVHRVFEKYYNT